MDHDFSTEPTEPSFSPSTEPGNQPTKPHTKHLPSRRRYTGGPRITMRHETELYTEKVLPRIKHSSSDKGVSSGVIITSSIVAFIGMIAFILIAVILVRFWKTRWKRRGNIRTVRSTTQLSFDNLSYTGEAGRRESVYQEVDMTDFEVLRTRVVMSIKRKVSAFSVSGKDKNQDHSAQDVNCGRLSIIETQYENTMDLGEIVQTHQV